MASGNEIRFHVLGDSGPFSQAGKSIGYMVTIGKKRYLVDCGSPLFNQIGGLDLEDIAGLIITHCHDDHKRWFTDLALYFKYESSNVKLPIMASETVMSDLMISSAAAMDRSLSTDSASVIDTPIDTFVDASVIGPRALYRIDKIQEGARWSYSVIDRDGETLPPDRAKVVISPLTGRPRMIFKDPASEEWVEPDSYYSFKAREFYEEDRNIHDDGELAIEAIKAPVWHGIPGIGLRFTVGTETLLLPSDTVHDTVLWERLCMEKRNQTLPLPRDEFDAAEVLFCDINDLIERTWSQQRYEEAMDSFGGSIVIQDVSIKDSIVHTDYVNLANTRLIPERTILTHSPDEITSTWALSFSGKEFIIKNSGVFEVVQGREYPLDADIYHKSDGKFYVGYKRDRGAYCVYEKGRMLSVAKADSKDKEDHGNLLYRVDLYEDISGRYFPILDTNDKSYIIRPDGDVELVKHHEKGSTGLLVESLRKPVDG